MWTIEAREIMLQGILDQMKDGAKLIFYFGNEEISYIDLISPVAILQNGSLIFNESEGLSKKTGTPDHALLVANDVVLLDMKIPEIINLDPSEIIAGSTVHINRFIIR